MVKRVPARLDFVIGMVSRGDKPALPLRSYAFFEAVDRRIGSRGARRGHRSSFHYCQLGKSACWRRLAENSSCGCRLLDAALLRRSPTTHQIVKLTLSNLATGSVAGADARSPGVVHVCGNGRLSQSQTRQPYCEKSGVALNSNATRQWCAASHRRAHAP